MPTSRAAVAAALLHLFLVPASHAYSLTLQGCYSAAPNLDFENTWKWQSSLYCSPFCQQAQKPVMGLTNGGDCYCGDLLPPVVDQTDDSACNKPCFGYGNETCGSLDGAFTVWLTGTDDHVGTADSSTSSSSSSAASSSTPSSVAVNPSSSAVETQTAAPVATTLPPSVVTIHGSTITSILGLATAVVSNSPPVSDGHSSGGSSTVGIAVGVVIGVLGALALVGAVLFFLKRRRSNASVDRHRRTTSVNPFGKAGQPPAYSISDSRLDQSMVERRNSTGSVFADNEDYSRRILKVTNPDG